MQITVIHEAPWREPAEVLAALARTAASWPAPRPRPSPTTIRPPGASLRRSRASRPGLRRGPIPGSQDAGSTSSPCWRCARSALGGASCVGARPTRRAPLFGRALAVRGRSLSFK